MIKEYILGTVIIKACGFEETELAEKLRKACKVISLYKHDDAIIVKTYAVYAKSVINLCESLGFVAEITESKGIPFTAKRYIKRYGILFGAIISIAFVLYISNIVMRIEIAGTKNDEIKQEILEILEEEGIYSGKYIPSINFIKTNISLNSLCDDISWSSISHNGSVVKVIVSETSPKDDVDSKRMPSNIIASRDGVIIKAEVLSGQLDVLVGDAVSKGELLVNGIIERRNGRVYYYHSFGEILAKYTESVVITQDYESVKKVYGDSNYIRSLRFFETDVFFQKEKSIENYDMTSDTTYLYFFGIKLPIGISTHEIKEVTYVTHKLSTEEAFMEAYRLLDNYEKNILSDEEIVSRRVEEMMNKGSVALLVDYELIGEIGIQQEIFAK